MGGLGALFDELMGEIPTVVLTTRLGASEWVDWGDNTFDTIPICCRQVYEPALTTNKRTGGLEALFDEQMREISAVATNTGLGQSKWVVGGGNAFVTILTCGSAGS